MQIIKEKLDYILNNIIECRELFEITDSDIIDNMDWYHITFESDLDQELSKISCPRDKRIKIFSYGINNMKGLKWVNSKLQEHDLRRAYCRNYNELIIYFCLKAIDNGYNVGVTEYKLIKKRCDSYRTSHGISYFNEEIDNTVTLRSLKKFLNDHTIKDSNGGSYTNTITTYIGTSIDNFFSGSLDEVINKLCELISANNIEYVMLNDKARYYIVKYLVILIEYNITEFIDVLKEIVGLNNFQLIQYIEALLNTTSVYNDNLWGIKNSLAKHSNEWHILIDEIKNDYEKSSNRVQLLRYSLLNAITNYLCIFGKPLNEQNVSPLFIKHSNQDKTHTCISLSDFSKIGNFFSNQNTNQIDKTKEIIKQVQALSISNFEDYKINFERVATLLFSVAEDTDISSIRRFFEKTINGTNDISRSTMLYLLMLIKQITTSNPISNDTLTVSRVNHILDRSGYEQLDSIENVFDALIEISLNMNNADFMCFYCDLINQYKEDTGESLIPLVFECKNSMLPLTSKI